MDRDAVIEDMQIAFAKIDDLVPLRIFYICVFDVPLFGYRPVEHPRAGWNLAHSQGNMLLKNLQRLPYSVAGNTSTNGIKLGDKLAHLMTNSLRSRGSLNRVPSHYLSQVGRCEIHYAIAASGAKSRVVCGF